MARFPASRQTTGRVAYMTMITEKTFSSPRQEMQSIEPNLWIWIKVVSGGSLYLARQVIHNGFSFWSRFIIERAALSSPSGFLQSTISTSLSSSRLLPFEVQNKETPPQPPVKMVRKSKHSAPQLEAAARAAPQ